LLRSSYGPRAERFDPRQLLLFGLLVPPIEFPMPPPMPPQPPGKSKSPNRSKHGRQKLPDHLPRLPIEHDLSESEKNCPCCGEQRQRIGQEKTEQLEYVPANFVVLEHNRHKYACPHCNSGHCHKCDGNAHIDLASYGSGTVPIEKELASSTGSPQAGSTPSPQAGSTPSTPSTSSVQARLLLAGPGLLAYVATSKLADHLPLYRLENIFARQQVHISRSTLSGWMAAAAQVVLPLYVLMCGRVRQSDVLHTDDTIVPIQHAERCRQGRLWTYVGDESNPYIVYDFTPTRAANGPLAWLGTWKGFLQADAYTGYDKLYARGDVVEVACWAHARRKFYDAQESDPARSLWMLEMIRRLYAVEKEAQDKTPPQRLHLRQSQSNPILEQIRLWLIAQQAQVLPRSPIAGAIGYCLNQWPALIVYTTDARLSIDNNVSERALRRVAVGRKNWLFAGHDESAQCHAILWSLIASAQRQEAEGKASAAEGDASVAEGKASAFDVQLYLRSVLAHLPGLPAEELQNYLPDVWKRDLMAEQQAALNVHHGKLIRAMSR
jgi:transposase